MIVGMGYSGTLMRLFCMTLLDERCQLVLIKIGCQYTRET